MQKLFSPYEPPSGVPDVQVSQRDWTRWVVFSHLGIILFFAYFARDGRMPDMGGFSFVVYPLAFSFYFLPLIAIYAAHTAKLSFRKKASVTLLEFALSLTQIWVLSFFV